MNLGASAFGATLDCWETNFSPRTPYLSAAIVNNTTLSNLKFNYKNSFENVAGELRGTVETSNRSPYKGNVKYAFPEGTLILPPMLTAEFLDGVFKKGFSNVYANENGTIIYSNGADDGGTHARLSLRCEVNDRD